MKHEEFELQKQICKFLTLQYPRVLFLSDTVANVRLTMRQAVRNKAIQCQGFHTPDLIIFEARHGFNGLFLELKKDSPFKKDGTLYKNEHLENQFQTILNLRKRGYVADFTWSFEMAVNQIRDYLK